MQINTRPDGLIMQRSELYEGLVALEQEPRPQQQQSPIPMQGLLHALAQSGRGLHSHASKFRGLGLEVVERLLDLEDVVVTPSCCVCAWKLPEAGQVRQNRIKLLIGSYGCAFMGA